MNVHELAAECLVRVKARLAFELDVGGHRTRDELEMVQRVVAAQTKRNRKVARDAK